MTIAMRKRWDVENGNISDCKGFIAGDSVTVSNSYSIVNGDDGMDNVSHVETYDVESTYEDDTDEEDVYETETGRRSVIIISDDKENEAKLYLFLMLVALFRQ